MTDIANEPAAMMATLLSQIITDIKDGRPTKTDGAGLTTGFVFSFPRRLRRRPVAGENGDDAGVVRGRPVCLGAREPVFQFDV
ncbi:MAG: hypothetical protein LC749_09430, partial [Actinobacteria bacterium]|nr:hypothetical protein [Actinomycetota bacterium]